MNAGRHAAGDGSFARSAGGAMTRGTVLIVVAIVIGILLIRTAADDGQVVAAPTSTEAPVETTTPSDTTSPPSTDDSGETTTTVAGPEETTTTVGEGETTSTTSGTGTFDARPNAEVQVQVVNTTNIGGAAGRTTDKLKALGFVTLKPTNSEEGALATSKIHHIGGYLLEAQSLAAELGLTNDNVFSMPDAPGANITDYQDPQVLVLIGTDLAE